MSTAKLSFIKAGAKISEQGVEMSYGDSLIFSTKGNILKFINRKDKINFDLETCSGEDLEKITEVLGAYNRQIVQENSKNISRFNNAKDGLEGRSQTMKSLIIFMGSIMTSLNILLNDGRIVINPLSEVKKQQYKESVISGVLQGMFFGLVKKVKGMKESTTTDEERKQKYEELIGICYRIIRSLGKITNNNDKNLQDLS